MSGVTVTQADELKLEWRNGPPPKPWADEWFIAQTIHGGSVCLTSLPEEHTYDFTTVDLTYMKAENIKRWMQFPDSEYVAPDARHRIEAEQRAYLEGARDMQEAAAEAAMTYRAWVNWTGDTFPDEPGTAIRAIDPNAMLRAREGGGE